MRGSGNRQAGGFILAIAVVAGAAAGVVLRQSSVGVLVGLGVGIAGAVLVWLLDRR
jgi:hypothetical protein